MGLFSRDKDLTSAPLPMLPLRDSVIFPHCILPVFVGRDASVRGIENAIAEHEKRILLITQCETSDENPMGLSRVGVISKVLQLLRLPDGSIKALFEGITRATWRPMEGQPYGSGSFPCLMATPVAEEKASATELEALVRATHEALEEFARAGRRINQESLAAISGLRDAGRLADMIMPHLKVETARKQEVLEIFHPARRLERVYELLSGEQAVASLEKSIKSRVKTQMERNQREYYLNEQIKAIQKEMGKEDDVFAETDELVEKADAKKLPQEARERVLREIKKIRQMGPAAPEYTASRNYVDWILDLPWQEIKETNIDIKEARHILDAEHFGLEKPKERILEYLAVQKLAGALKGPILCLVGPPGVGKTSLAKSVAKATGRDFVRLSLGGVRDEAEIRGHRRTYIGALPGKILMALKRAKSNNPLFCLDEIDKMTSDFRGDPSAALLEVLDPEQNSAFNDHYLDLDYDLSQIFFITTANSLAGIPVALQDRMEIIHLSSYLETEKMHIARDFLLPRQCELHGLRQEDLRVSDQALLEVIRHYTREAGVRNLEREIAALCRKIAIQLVEHQSCPGVTRQNLHTLLGVKRYRFGEREDGPQVGVCTGLAFNDRGGSILLVETALMPGSGKVSTTGQLGEVMTESAQAALSYVRSRSAMLGLKPDFHKEVDIHVHVPEGATPKDGPSAGITLATSITSALLGIPVRHDVAMTGEITLRGRVLPIGGLREKLLAARRAGMATVLIPRDNEKDLKEVPDEILRSLKIVYVDHVDDVLPLALAAPRAEIFPDNQETSFFLSLRAAPGPATGL